MSDDHSLRSRKKAQTRQRIADVAAELFAQQGYDAVTMVAVARAAEVSEQTVYNYFPAKQDLVLDRAAQFREMYRDAITRRDEGTSAAAALLPLVRADVERYRTADLGVAQGEFIAQSVESPVFRRFSLEERERQAQVVTEALVATSPELLPIIAHAHACSIIAVVRAVHDEIGSSVLSRADQEGSAAAIRTTLDAGFGSLDRTFAALLVAAGSSAD